MTKPYTYMQLSQAPGVYELSFVSGGVTITYDGTLTEFTLLAQAILHQIGVQQQRDAEARSSVT